MKSRCKVCGRALRNPDSVAKGMGPSCERKVLGVVRGIKASRPLREADDGYSCVGLLGGSEDEGDD